MIKIVCPPCEIFPDVMPLVSCSKKVSGNQNMGCCEFELLELSQYRIVSKVKNQHRTNSFRDKIHCCQCNEIIEHEFLKKNLLGFAVRISCPGCGWKFEG